MDIQSKLNSLSDKIKSMKDKIETEEATKTAFVLPFINLLGYDIFNPTEVVPEFTADIGLKKGEKVDFAIFHNDEPILIVECKHWNEKLDIHSSQLFRYFHVSKSRFALLTNGIEYRFFADLDETNKMDEKPFLEFDVAKLKDTTIQEISKFHKSNFDLDKIVNNASSLKYTKEIKKVFNKELVEPSPDFIRYFSSKVYNGRLTEKVIEQFRSLVQKAINQLISENVNDRLISALDKEAEQQEVENVEEVEESKIITTDEELDAFRIVTAILRRKLSISRIAHRDTQSYFGILLDDNNRKPLARIYINGNRKYIGVFDDKKNERKHQIESIDEIYSFEEELLKTIDYYNH